MTRIEIVNDQKLPFSLHDDILAIGSHIGINKKASQRAKFHASNDLLLVDRKSISLKL